MIKKDNLPKEWKIKHLSDVVEFWDSKRIPLSKKQRNDMQGEYPYYGASGIVDYVNDYIFDNELVLVGEDGQNLISRNKPLAFKAKGKIWVNNHAHVLKPTDININFLIYQLNLIDFTPYVTGSAQPKLNQKRLAKVELIVPPLKTQKKIVEILKKVEKLKEWRAEADELADDYLKSVFLEMFGEPVKNGKGWDFFKFGEVGKLERGKSKHRPRNAPELLGGPYPLIQTGEVAGSGGYIKTHTQTYSEIGLKQSRMWSKGTLCITIAANIAKTGILTFDACFPDSIVGFTPNNHVKVEYVQHWLSFLQKILEESAPESAQKNINLKILSNLEIPIPPFELQEKFVEISEKLNQLKTHQNQSKQEIDNLFNTLMQKAFKGELVC
jgi:type I restriction enzyme, S subunit